MIKLEIFSFRLGTWLTNMNNYKELVVNQAIEGLKFGGLSTAEVFRTLLERVYQAGYNEAMRQEIEKIEKRYRDTISGAGMKYE
jgi:hypothetical protein